MITIQYINPPPHLIRFTENGGLYFDLDSEFTLRLTKGIEQLTDIDSIAQEAALINTISATPKNVALLEGFELNALASDTKSIRVKVLKDGQELDVNRLRVVSFADADREIEIELFGSAWIDDLEAILLRDVDLGTFEYTKANVEAAWADLTALAVPALADYGNWVTPGDVTRKDLRFKFNLWKVLKLCFCEIGWSVRSPFFEAYGGYGLYGYLSGPNWHSYRDKSSPNAAFLNIATPQTFTPAFFQTVAMDEVSDPDNAYVVDIYTYPTGEPRTTITFTFSEWAIRFYSDQIVGFYNAVLNIRIERDRSGEITDLGGFSFANNIIGEHSLVANFVVTDFTGIPGDEYRIKLDFAAGFGIFPGNGFVDIQSGDTSIIPDTPYYIEDDLITLQDLLSEDLNALQLFEGMIHLCNGKVVTDNATNTVTIYPPFPVAYAPTVNLSDLDGFFVRDQGVKVLSELVVPRSRVVDIKEEERDRYIEIRFADAQDAYIKEQFDEDQPFSRTVDLGFGKAKTTTIENPLFEPSIEREQDNADTGGTLLNGISLPVHWDNTSGKSSTDIGFRIGHHYGLVNQPTAGGPANWTWEGALRTLMPYITQVPERAITNLLTPMVPVSFFDFADDYYNRFYRLWIRENFGRFDVQFLAQIDLSKYRELDFRKPVNIKYGEANISYQLIAIRDFDVSSKVSTPIDLKIISC